MMKIVYILIALLFSTCKTVCDSETSVIGEFVGNSCSSKNKIGLNYQLKLKTDSTCEFIKYFDLYRETGTGKWAKKGNLIIIKYDNHPVDIRTLIMNGKYMMGGDTIWIQNSDKLVYGKNVVLKKTEKK